MLNRLANSDVLVADQLFATLDPTTRRVELPGGHLSLFTDTVGFIQKLPTQLVAAFQATLEEIAEADLLIHVVDITHPNALAQWEAVNNTLADIQADHIPVITTLNKTDALSDSAEISQILPDFPGAVAISALKGFAIPDLLRSVERELFEVFVPIRVRLPFQQGQLISIFHEQGRVESIEHERGGVVISGSLPGRLLARFEAFTGPAVSAQPPTSLDEEEQTE